MTIPKTKEQQVFEQLIPTIVNMLSVLSPKEREKAFAFIMQLYQERM